MSRPNLKQVSALFEACLAQIRNQPEHNFDKAAEEFIKAARVGVMRNIERHFLEIAQNVNNPHLLPYWAINPSTPLDIYTTCHSHQLDPYIPAFKTELQNLMEECGFNATVRTVDFFTTETNYCISIRFPITPQNSVTYPTRCFNSLPKFSAAMLKITQSVEPLAVPEPDASTSRTKREARRTSAKKSAPGATRTSKPSRDVKRARDTNPGNGPPGDARTPKRLRSSASVANVTGEHSDEIDGPRRSMRLRDSLRRPY